MGTGITNVEPLGPESRMNPLAAIVVPEAIHPTTPHRGSPPQDGPIIPDTTLPVGPKK